MAPKLSRVTEVMQAQVDADEISGAVTAVARRGGELVHLESYGYKDIEAGTPMPLDAIFRMASSTKPITGVAAMMMIEQGKLGVDDLVRDYIPELADPKVAVRKHPAAETPEGEEPEIELVPADRDITVKDLLTHTSGLMSGGRGSRTTTVRREPGDTLASYIPRLGEVPLDFQPGTRWAYSGATGLDVVARILEIISGQSFDRYLHERVFEPLGMVDTFFSVPEDKLDRLLPLYRKTEEGWERQTRDRITGRGTGPVTYFSASGGLLSTYHDFLQFQLMLLQGGEHNGHRLLQPETVELMSTNHVGDLFRGLGRDQDGVGFGYTVSVTLDPDKARGARPAGSFGWGGAFGTLTWTDPVRELAVVLMLQQRNQQVQGRFERALKEALGE